MIFHSLCRLYVRWHTCSAGPLFTSSIHAGWHLFAAFPTTKCERIYAYVVRCSQLNWTERTNARFVRRPLPPIPLPTLRTRFPHRARVLIAHYELAPLAQVEHIKSWSLADSLKWSNGKYKYFSAHSYEVAGTEQKGVFRTFSGQSGHRLYHQNEIHKREHTH